MTGAHLGANIFKCATVEGGFSAFTVDFGWGSTWFCPKAPGDSGLSCTPPRNNMHACPKGWVMIGYNSSVNRLFCGLPTGGATKLEYVDGGTSDGSMHICRENVSNPNRFAMSGINAGANQFTCAQ